MDGDVLLDLAARRLIGGEARFRVGELLLRGFDARVEGARALRFLGEPALRVVRRGVQLLQRDGPFEIRVHAVQENSNIVP